MTVKARLMTDEKLADLLAWLEQRGLCDREYCGQHDCRTVKALLEHILALEEKYTKSYVPPKGTLEAIRWFAVERRDRTLGHE